MKTKTKYENSIKYMEEKIQRNTIEGIVLTIINAINIYAIGWLGTRLFYVNNPVNIISTGMVLYYVIIIMAGCVEKISKKKKESNKLRKKINKIKYENEDR